MTEAIVAFQSQLSDVMETVLKAAMCEITRLVEHSFLAEVLRSQQEVEALRRRLQWSESKRREQETGARSRCAECSRTGTDLGHTEDRLTAADQVTGADEADTHHHHVRHREPTRGSNVRQDSQPSSAHITEHLRSRQEVGETSHLYTLQAEREHATQRLSEAALSCTVGSDDLDSESVAWTAFKLGDSDSETDGLDSSYTAGQEPSSESDNRRELWAAGSSEDGSSQKGLSVPCVSVKAEMELADTMAIKEESEMDPLWSEEIPEEVTQLLHRQLQQTGHRAGVQVDDVIGSSPLQHVVKRHKSLSGQNEGARTTETDSDVGIAENREDSEFRDRNTVCLESIRVSKTLQSHSFVYRREKPFICSQCGKSFTQLKNLQAHLKQHSGVRPHSCSQCGKSFLYLSRLKVHLLSHTGERPFSCTQCGKSFLSFYDLKVHQRNHTGEKPYSCAQCGKGFTRLSILKEHRSIHTKEKCFTCTQCGKRFTRLSNLKAHLRQHAGKKPYGCNQCGKSFLYLCRLQKHQNKSHDQQY